MLVRETCCRFDQQFRDIDIGYGYEVSVTAPWLEEPVRTFWVGNHVNDRLSFFRDLDNIAWMNVIKTPPVTEFLLRERLKNLGKDAFLASRDGSAGIIRSIFGDENFLNSHLFTGSRGPGWAVARFEKRGDDIFLAYMDGVLAGMTPVRSGFVVSRERSELMADIVDAAGDGDQDHFRKLVSRIGLNPGEAEVETEWLAAPARKKDMAIVATELEGEIPPEIMPGNSASCSLSPA